MRRPLTTRRWFRVSLVLFLLTAGYFIAYGATRTFSDEGDLVAFEYPGSTRVIATTPRGDFVVSTLCFTSPARAYPSIWLHANPDSVRNRIWSVFAPAERVEMAMRGVRPYARDTTPFDIDTLIDAVDNTPPPTADPAI